MRGQCFSKKTVNSLDFPQIPMISSLTACLLEAAFAQASQVTITSILQWHPLVVPVVHDPPPFLTDEERPRSLPGRSGSVATADMPDRSSGG